MEDDHSGEVLIICSAGELSDTTRLFKAMCDTVPYDPAKQFCYEHYLYSCGGEPFNPATHYCKNAASIEKYGKLEDNRDEDHPQTYKTVVIGSKTWMAENLNYADSTSSPNLKEATWCYGNNEAYCAKYGRLYTWAAAIDFSESSCGVGHYCNNNKEGNRGICPIGWHLPSTTEWNALLKGISGLDYVAVELLMAKSDWNSGRVPAGTDAYGFTALPAGYRSNNRNFENYGNRVSFWSATEVDKNRADFLNLENDDVNAYVKSFTKSNAYSVRCVQD